MSTNYISVILPLGLAESYTYSVPATMQCPSIGTRVLVPLGKKVCVGIVDAVGINLPPHLNAERVKPMIGVADSQPLVSADQLHLWHWMSTYYMCPIGDVMAAALPSKVMDKTWSLDRHKRRVKLPVFSDEVEDIHPLSAAQALAKQEIEEQWKQHQVTLLHGVTSSGKTEVYIHLIKEQLAQGKQVLYLVPEIALTTQLTNRLQKVFGNQLWVYHSRISDGQRMEIYRQLVTDKQVCKVVVGARSAVFLPLQQVGLVIIDEEHEPSYKQQDPAPRYHARSVAIMMAHQMGAKVLLGTATPSIESYYNAQEGKYGLVRLTERYAGLDLPQIRLVDLERQYHRKEMYGHLSDPLVERMQQELAKGKQIILFQNRRGYAPMLKCEKCQYSPKCPDCDVPMTLHLHEHEMRCHYCGHSEAIPTICPECGGPLKVYGFGTERIEDEIAEFFPTARTLRMDLDTTRKKDDYEQIIGQFSRHEVDILIGTQMVSKGLHFDDVSLVAVLSADHLFMQPDFRSFERCYQMLEQVAGRAGRKGSQGEVIIQTWDVKHPVFDYVQTHDYERLYASQITEREHFGYPPFYRQIMVTLRHGQSSVVQGATEVLQDRLQQVFGARVSGVITPSIARIQKWHIRHIRLKIESRAKIENAKQLLSEQIRVVNGMKEYKSVNIYVDVDPM